METSPTRRVLTLLLACLVSVPFLAAATGPAVAAVPTCRLGAYVADLYALDTRRQTIGADIWFWSVCPRADMEPIRRFEFINASQTRRADRVSVWDDGMYWTYEKVVATYRERFVIRDYPFDRHTLDFVVEHTQDATRFVYTADPANSTYNPGIRPDGFSISRFRVLVRDHRYRTTFGAPRLRPGNGSAYSQFVVRMSIERTDVSGFVRETWPVYVSFLIALATFFIWFEDATAVLGARLGMLGAALFTIVVNLRAVNESLGTGVGMTLVDQIHLYTLVYVLVGVATTTYSWRIAVRPEGGFQAQRFNHWVALVASLLYVAGLAAAVASAVVG
ncbi:hypothetical protein [Streptomyces sp. NPDC007264]|uniref:hypothetical protein n=1 Tax=Streptomyces sp. NPDC007264 TaxID=3364777 RepID=UPI0036D80817